MFPIALDLKKIPILLIGEGEAYTKRHKQLVEYGAAQFAVCHTAEGRYPCFEDMDASLRWHDKKIVMIAGLSYERSKQLATAARAAGKLVNVEDMNDLCDFYFTANVKRGDLVISVSTGGASPTLSRKIRDYIAERFSAQWEDRVVEIANFRKKLKADGKNIPEVLAESEKFLAIKGWLK